MTLDPMTIIMFGLIAVLIIFMIRNGKKRQAAAREMQDNLRPGAEVMLQSGIYGVIDEVDEEANRVTVTSGNSTLVVHRNAVGQIVTPIESTEEPSADLAPDDDPEFGERLGGAATDAAESASLDGAAGTESAADSGAADSSTADPAAGESGAAGDADGESKA